MKQFVVSTSIINGSIFLYVDNELVEETDKEQTIKNLEKDGEHIVHWYVEGAPGSSYTITISAPRNAEFELTKCLGMGGKDFGGFSFGVNKV